MNAASKSISFHQIQLVEKARQNLMKSMKRKKMMKNFSENF
jgi:hypothetical protein